ncbi:dTDP-4-dehydrorhamnose reductase [Quadrisphaera sp. DSM 44207]|uniref:dTDP-4-dehydrorhamnose reductase n=1 Tax=Quadrisphaera sp. DSM 44207 TaxID=1881057 RepID=UPI0008811CBE|nr:dTDP-4-dehydrorhamnose reductase [Quadrisphaera sp. DSM 44207]SDQ66659.1 dTDP-4-dehydrorhamnose reductase [Quadrisphaera sp. DSM 44207]
MRCLVVGAGGMLGQDLVDVLAAAGHAVTAATRADLDVLDAGALAGAVPGHDAVVNAAAWTAVDDAETAEGAAFALNALAPALLARAASAAGARLVHVSTDYVFDGAAGHPYAEDAPPAPRSAYGRTKAAGEWAVRAHAPDALVVRTAWLYGAGGACFPRTIARLAAERGGVSVVDDQVGQPTWTRDVAGVVAALLEVGAPGGVYHATSSGRTSWHGFARAVVASAGLHPQLVAPTTSAAFVRPAARPAFSVLGHGALRAVGVEPIGPWAQRWEAAAHAVLQAVPGLGPGVAPGVAPGAGVRA